MNQQIRPEVIARVKEVATQGKLTCQEAWRIANELQVPFLEVGRAADDSGIKIIACQLGCF
ncbi:MAG: hypothetical protein ACOY9Y_11175 [Bacillota bacterium]